MSETTRTKLWEAIGQYGAEVASSGRMAPPDYLIAAVDAATPPTPDLDAVVARLSEYTADDVLQLMTCGSEELVADLRALLAAVAHLTHAEKVLNEMLLSAYANNAEAYRQRDAALLRPAPLPADVQAAVERVETHIRNVEDADEVFDTDIRTLLAHLTREAPDAGA